MKNCLIVVDTNKYNLSLGTTLIFIEHVKMFQETHNINRLDLAIISNDKLLVSTLILPLFHIYLDFETSVIFSIKEDFEKYFTCNTYTFSFPDSDFSTDKNAFDSTILIQDHFKKYNSIPLLIPTKHLRDWASYYIKQLGHDMVIVHLKNVKGSQSNAIQSEWLEFFNYCEYHHPKYKFFIIGKDELLQEITALQNVVITRYEGLSLLQELALIDQASLFMGMCSGPFNAALLSNTPYIVFKNPTHHENEMILQIGKFDQFPFSTDQQFIFRNKEYCEMLLEHFNKIYDPRSNKE